MLHRSTTILLLALISLTVVNPAHASAPPDSRAPISAFDAGAFDRALRRLTAHPEIAASDARSQALSEVADGALALPDPMLFVSEQDFPVGASTSQDFEQKMLGVRQQVPAFGTRGAKSARAASESRKLRLAGAYSFARLKAKLIAALAGLHNLKQQDRLLAEQLALNAAERKSLHGRIAADRARLSDLTAIDAETARIDLARTELTERRHELESGLQNLLGDVPDIAPPAITLWSGAPNPDRTFPLALAGEDIAMANADIDLRAAEFGPAFEVQAGMGRMRNGDNTATIMVGLSIPIWAAESQAPNLRAAQAQRSASELERDVLTREVGAALTHLRLQVATSEKKLSLWTAKIATLTRGGEALTRDYSAGRAELGDTLKASRDMLDARMALAEEEARHTALIADYNRYFVTGEAP